MAPDFLDRLDDRFGIETSAKGGRFKLNRDMAGFHNSSRAGIVIEANEAKIKINIASPDKLRTLGDLLYFDRIDFRFAKAKTSLLEDVTFTVEQGDRLAFVGAVSWSDTDKPDIFPKDLDLCFTYTSWCCSVERSRKIDSRQAYLRNERIPTVQRKHNTTSPPDNRLLLAALSRRTFPPSLAVSSLPHFYSRDRFFLLPRSFRQEGREVSRAGCESLFGFFWIARQGG